MSHEVRTLYLSVIIFIRQKVYNAVQIIIAMGCGAAELLLATSTTRFSAQSLHTTANTTDKAEEKCNMCNHNVVNVLLSHRQSSQSFKDWDPIFFSGILLLLLFD